MTCVVGLVVLAAEAVLGWLTACSMWRLRRCRLQLMVDAGQFEQDPHDRGRRGQSEGDAGGVRGRMGSEELDERT